MIDADHEIVLRAILDVIRLLDGNDTALGNARQDCRVALVVDGKFVDITPLVLNDTDRTGANVGRADYFDDKTLASVMCFYAEFT